METTERPILALLLRLLSALMLSTMFLGVKYAGTRGIALPEIMFWRQAASIPIICIWLGLTGGFHRLRTKRFSRHALRGIVGATGMVFGFGAVTLLPLAEATTLGFTAPFFAVILSALVMREHVGPWRWTAVAVGFIGVLVITRPGGEAIPALGMAAALGSALVVGIVSFQIKDLARTESTFAIVFYFALVGTAVMAPLLPFFITRHEAFDWLVLLSLGAFGTLGQLLVSLSLRHGAVANVIIMDYTSLIWATLYGWLVWERIPPLATWLGAPLIIMAGVIVFWREHRMARALPQASAKEMDQGSDR